MDVANIGDFVLSLVGAGTIAAIVGGLVKAKKYLLILQNIASRLDSYVTELTEALDAISGLLDGFDAEELKAATKEVKDVVEASKKIVNDVKKSVKKSVAEKKKSVDKKKK